MQTISVKGALVDRVCCMAHTLHCCFYATTSGAGMPCKVSLICSKIMSPQYSAAAIQVNRQRPCQVVSPSTWSDPVQHASVKWRALHESSCQHLQTASSLRSPGALSTCLCNDAADGTLLTDPRPNTLLKAAAYRGGWIPTQKST